MNSNIRWGVLVLSLLFMAGWAAQAQTSSSASASSSFGSNETAEVRLGGFAFEPGSPLSLEITRNAQATCLQGPVHVLGLDLVDASGRIFHTESYDAGVLMDTWIGRIRLASPEGMPLPAGAYRLRATTSVGDFVAEIEVVEPSRLGRLGRYSASASVCGLSLNVYRLLGELDHGSHSHLRVGDRLMILLPGNPTTGYQWDADLLHELPVLLQAGEIEFRPESPGLAGSGGIFIFRYEAVEIGLQQIRLIYHRSWESVPPSRTVDLHIAIE